uniref:Secreted protein n=1 Tax=Heterorhabditis bacteriophora TaxID=37862 RepID=A0A1I7WJX8_HETBA
MLLLFFGLYLPVSLFIRIFRVQVFVNLPRQITTDQIAVPRSTNYLANATTTDKGRTRNRLFKTDDVVLLQDPSHFPLSLHEMFKLHAFRSDNLCLFGHLLAIG